MDGFVEIMRLDNKAEADIVASCLEAHGIEIWLKDDLVHSVMPHLGFAMGGIKIYVAEENKQKALELLSHLNSEYDEHALEENAEKKNKLTEQEKRNPSAKLSAKATEDSKFSAEIAQNAKLGNAFQVAIIAFLTLPGLVNIYLTFKIMKLWKGFAAFSRSQKIELFIIFLLNLMGYFWAAVIVSIFLS